MNSSRASHHSVLPPKQWGNFLVLKKIFSFVLWSCFHFKKGEESPYGGLDKKVLKGGFNFKKLNCIFFLSFSQFRKIV